MKPIEWPSGGTWVVGAVRTSRAKSVCAAWEPVMTDLGPAECAMFRDVVIGPVIFERDLNVPDEVEVIVDAEIARDAVLAMLNRRLHLKPSDFTWLATGNTRPEEMAAARTQAS